MKRIIGCASLFILWSATAMAQTTIPKKSVKHTTVHKATAPKTTVTSKQAKPAVTPAAPAIAETPATDLQITDPTVKALNERANGNNVPISSSGIVGMPKRSYGVANEHITFKSSDATTSGTATGSGAVGTGNSAGVVGRSGQTIGVNGKSPYAGPSIQGTPATAPPKTPVNSVPPKAPVKPVTNQ